MPIEESSTPVPGSTDARAWAVVVFPPRAPVISTVRYGRAFPRQKGII
ncbi:hypothetical protein [Methanogenium cariaci]|nr:hypothetical protein [Methanogenium cariaci]